MRMWILLRVIVAQNWGCPNTTLQHWSWWTCAKSGVGANQHNLQYSTSVNTAIHQWQDFSRYTLFLLTQEIKRDMIYRRMNLPPLSTTSNSHLTTHSSSRLYHKEAMVISTTHLSCQILPGYPRLCCNLKKTILLDVILPENPCFWPHFMSW